MVAEGAPELGNTSTVAVAEQPFNGSVAVTVYIPAAQAEVTAFVVEPQTPASQLNVALPGADALALNVTEGVEHVNVWLDPALTPLGATVFSPTDVVVEYWQSLAGFITVKEYTPIPEAIAFCELDPLEMFPVEGADQV